jgi:hypothetical protein
VEKLAKLNVLPGTFYILCISLKMARIAETCPQKIINSEKNKKLSHDCRIT